MLVVTLRPNFALHYNRPFTYSSADFCSICHHFSLMFKATHLTQSFFSIIFALSLGDHLFPFLVKDLKNLPSILSYPFLSQAIQSVTLAH